MDVEASNKHLRMLTSQCITAVLFMQTAFYFLDVFISKSIHPIYEAYYPRTSQVEKWKV